MSEVLPPHLAHPNWEPLEPEHIPLQVALLTMELASLRPRLGAMERALDRLIAGLESSLERVRHDHD
jgi:hypothetical protein